MLAAPRILYTKDLPHSPIWESVIHKTDNDRVGNPAKGW